MTELYASFHDYDYIQGDPGVHGDAGIPGKDGSPGAPGEPGETGPVGAPVSSMLAKWRTSVNISFDFYRAFQVLLGSWDFVESQ